MHEYVWHFSLIIILVILIIVLVAIPHHAPFADYSSKVIDGRYMPEENVGNYLFNMNTAMPVVVPSWDKYMLSILVPSSQYSHNYEHLGKFMHVRGIDCAYLHALHEGEYIAPMDFIEKILLRLPKNAIVGLIYEREVNFKQGKYDYSKVFGGLSWDKAKDERYGKSIAECPSGVAKIRADSGLCSYQVRPIPELSSHNETCDYYPPGCPNYIEQFCAYANVINALIMRDKIKCAMITRIYNISAHVHETQILIATKLFPYLGNVVIMKGHISSNKNCGKSLFAMLQNQCCDSVDSCGIISRLSRDRARDTVEMVYQNNPEGLLRYINAKNKITNNPTFDISSLDLSCQENCGGQNSFGTWTWPNFKKFMDGYYALASQHLLTQEFILDNWGKVPLSWMP
jgi:hypothetical protein